jgi:hypothetical protein
VQQQLAPRQLLRLVRRQRGAPRRTRHGWQPRPRPRARAQQQRPAPGAAAPAPEPTHPRSSPSSASVSSDTAMPRVPKRPVRPTLWV